MASITDEDYQKQVSDSFRKHVSTKLRAAYPSIAKDATDDELFSVWHKLTVPDATPEEANQVLVKVYGEDWTPPERPTPTLMEKAGDIGKAALGVGKNIAQGLAEFGGASAVGKIASKIPGAGQLAMAVPTAVRMAGQQIAGNKLEHTAEQIPEPNIAELRARGMSEDQIHNIVKGYTDTQNSLMQDVSDVGKAGISEAASGIANAAFLNPRTSMIENVGKQATTALAKTGVKALASNAVSGAVQHGITGAAVGAGYGAVQQASERMGQAAAEGAKADQILAAGTSGALQGGKAGALVGGALGGALGGTAGLVSSAVSENAARKAAAAKSVNDALAVKLQQFGRTFNPQWLQERFPEDLKLANEQGLPDETLAHNIIANVYGPEVAASEQGMRAAGDIFEKIKTWRNINLGLQGPMVELPKQPVGPEFIPNIAQPVGAPIEPPVGGQPPLPNQYDMGSIAQNPTQVPPPQNVTPVPGLEGMPTPQQGTVPMQLEGVAPQEPAPAAARLTQPLGADIATNRISSPIPNAEPQERLQTVPSPSPEVTYATPPALVLPQPGPVPVRNLGGGPEDFGNRELTAPSAPPTRVEQLTTMLQEAISKNDLKSIVKITEALKKEVIAQKKLAARKEKAHA